MKKFVRNILLFLAATSVVMACVVIAVNQRLTVEGFYKINKKHQALILGDSHPECALNDSLMQHVKNYAQSGETYFYTYLKLKRILENNAHVKRVYVEFNAGQVLKSIDKSTWDNVHVSAKLPKYAVCMDIKDYVVLLMHNPIGTVNAIVLTMSQNWELANEEEEHFNALSWGQYIALDRNGEDALAITPPGSSMVDQELRGTSSVNLNYLDKVIALGKEYGVEVVLIRCPVHWSYSGVRAEKTFQYIVQTRYKDVVFRDFMTYNMPTHELADEHHLNRQGAFRFSKYFKTELGIE